jgi:formylglycine-generating enzyme required for sulfatase activity
LTYGWLYLLAYASAERHRVAELARGLDALPGGRRAFASTAFVAHAAEHLLGTRPLDALLTEARERDQDARAKGTAESPNRHEDEVAALRAIVAPRDAMTTTLAMPALGRLARETFELPVLTQWAREQALAAPPAVKNGGRWIDRFEVTVDDWRGCERAGACRPLSPYSCEPEAGGLSGFDLRTWWAGSHCFPLESNPYPATWVPHADAKAFCRWRGGALPTRAEWVAASRLGPTPPRPELLGNTNDSFGCDLMPERGGIALCDPAVPFDGFLGIAPIGAFPAGASAIGAQDLVGNVREWLDDGSVAGASWLRPMKESGEIRRAERYADADLGFRCAYEAPPSGRAALAKAGSPPRLARVGLTWKKVPAGVRKPLERRKDEVRVEADYAVFSDFRVPTCLRRKLSEPCVDLTGFGDRTQDKHRFLFPGGLRADAKVAAFEILESEVTREQWAAVMELADPSWERCAGCAASRVRAVEAEAFCKKVGGRLPSEDEWLWALESGGDSAEMSLTRASTRGERAAAASAKADKHGVRGLLGGLWEWLAPEAGVDSWLTEVVGGSFATPAEVVGPDARVTVHRGARSEFIGFRCVR